MRSREENSAAHGLRERLVNLRENARNAHNQCRVVLRRRPCTVAEAYEAERVCRGLELQANQLAMSVRAVMRARAAKRGGE